MSLAPTGERAAAHSPRAALIVGSLVFLMLGVLVAQLGPVLSELAARTSSTLAGVGAIFSALYLGALPTQSAAGPLIDRVGSRPVLLVGIVVTVTGMLGVALSRSLPVLLASGLWAGLGFGCVTIGTNLLVAHAYRERSVSALNLANVFYGVGAVTGPALAGLALHLWGTGMPAIWIGLALFVPLLAGVYALKEAAPAGMQARSDRQPAAALYRSPVLWALAVLLLLYVGLEGAMSGWTATYLQTTTAMPLASAALVVSAYWLALTGGRLVNSWLGMSLSADRVLLLSLGGAVAGGLLLVLTTGRAVPTIAGVMVLGFSFGAIFPTALALVTTTFPTRSGKAASAAQATGSVGGMTLPWLLGLVLVQTGPAASMIFMAVGTAAMLALYLAVRHLLGEPERLAALPSDWAGDKAD